MAKIVSVIRYWISMEGNYENMDPVTTGRSRRTQACFTISVLLAQLVGVAAVIITGVWASKYHDGFAWRVRYDFISTRPLTWHLFTQHVNHTGTCINAINSYNST